MRRSIVNGLFITGMPIKIDSVGNEKHLAFLSTIDRSQSLTYIPLRAVTSVTLENFETYLSSLTQGDAWSLNLEDAPSRLAIERKCVQVSESFSKTGLNLNLSLDWKSPESPAHRLLAGQLLDALQLAFNELSGEPLAQDSLRQIRKVTLELRPDCGLEATRDGENIKIRFFRLSCA